MSYHRGGHPGAVAVSYTSTMAPLSPSRRYSGSNGTSTGGSSSTSSTTSKYSYRASASDRPGSCYSSTSSSGYRSSSFASSTDSYRKPYIPPARLVSSYNESSSIGSSRYGSASSSSASSTASSSSSSASRDRNGDLHHQPSTTSLVTSTADFYAKYSPTHYVPNIYNSSSLTSSNKPTSSLNNGHWRPSSSSSSSGISPSLLLNAELHGGDEYDSCRERRERSFSSSEASSGIGLSSLGSNSNNGDRWSARREAKRRATPTLLQEAVNEVTQIGEGRGKLEGSGEVRGGSGGPSGGPSPGLVVGVSSTRATTSSTTAVVSIQGDEQSDCRRANDTDRDDKRDARDLDNNNLPNNINNKINNNVNNNINNNNNSSSEGVSGKSKSSKGGGNEGWSESGVGRNGNGDTEEVVKIVDEESGQSDGQRRRRRRGVAEQQQLQQQVESGGTEVSDGKEGVKEDRARAAAAKEEEEQREGEDKSDESVAGPKKRDSNEGVCCDISERAKLFLGSEPREAGNRQHHHQHHHQLRGRGSSEEPRAGEKSVRVVKERTSPASNASLTLSSASSSPGSFGQDSSVDSASVANSSAGLPSSCGNAASVLPALSSKSSGSESREKRKSCELPRVGGPASSVGTRDDSGGGGGGGGVVVGVGGGVVAVTAAAAAPVAEADYRRTAYTWSKRDTNIDNTELLTNNNGQDRERASSSQPSISTSVGTSRALTSRSSQLPVAPRKSLLWTATDPVEDSFDSGIENSEEREGKEEPRVSSVLASAAPLILVNDHDDAVSRPSNGLNNKEELPDEEDEEEDEEDEPNPSCDLDSREQPSRNGVAIRVNGATEKPSGTRSDEPGKPSGSRRTLFGWNDPANDDLTGPSSSTAAASSSNSATNSAPVAVHQNLYRGLSDQIDESSNSRPPRSRLQSRRDERYGLNGLRNIGNTCFMNSVIQCLSNTRPLLEYLLNEQHLHDINTTTSSMKGALIKAFGQVIHELWEMSGDHVVNTTALKSQIQRFAPRFMGYSQQDAQEFLRYLLEGLHEDVNRVTVKPQPILTDIPDHYSDSHKAAESWKRYLRSEDSTIVDVFVGQLRSSLHCTSCDHVSVTLDPFWDLSLPIPARSGTVKLNQCLEHFTKAETMDGDEKPTCSKCQMRRKCTKSFSIQKFPKILVIHLKRFSPTERFRGKLSVLVDFPLTGLDLSAFAAPGVQGPTYNLYGVANHSGTTYSGHYTAYCKHPYSGEWHEYNDNRVSSVPGRSVVSSEAYVLFYEQQPPSPHL